METWIDEPCPVDHDADEAEVASAAGLRYVEVAALGWERRRCGRGFTYVDERGATLQGAARERCEALVIPPAWTEVRICCHEDGHVLATGRDDAGRKQYLYHPAWREMRDRQKFARLGLFGDRLTRLRKRVRTDLRQDDLTLERAAAAAVRLMDRALVRVGNDEYVEDQETFGVTTFEPRHVEVVGDAVHLEYSGKGSVERHQVVEDDPDLARAVRDCLAVGADQLLCARSGDQVVDLTSEHVNDYVGRLAGVPCSAKDFRTWGGTVVATEVLANVDRSVDDGDVLDAVDAAAEALGNTRAVARSSYVAPQVVAAATSGELQELWASSRTSRWMSRAEQTCRKVLAP